MAQEVWGCIGELIGVGRSLPKLRAKQPLPSPPLQDLLRIVMKLAPQESAVEAVEQVCIGDEGLKGSGEG